MLLHESETIELKEMVVDDIKKEIVLLQIVRVVSYILEFGMMALWWGLKIQMVLHFRSVIWSEMRSNRISRCFYIMRH